MSIFRLHIYCMYSVSVACTYLYVLPSKRKNELKFDHKKKFFDHRPQDQISLMDAMDSASQDIPAKHSQG